LVVGELERHVCNALRNQLEQVRIGIRQVVTPSAWVIDTPTIEARDPSVVVSNDATPDPNLGLRLTQFCKVAIPAFGTLPILNEFESVPSLPTGPSGQNTGHEYTGTPAVAPAHAIFNMAVAEKPAGRFMIRARTRVVKRHPEGDW